MNPVLQFASALSRDTKWHGDHTLNDRQLLLRAGLLTMVYENGSIRNISTENREIIRMIYTALRDKYWLTINPVIYDEQFNIKADSFIISYRCCYNSGEINFSAICTIEGQSDSSLVFTFEGEALTQFVKNRIGFCVLHPVEGVAGEQCIIFHHNNDSETIEFPRYISPHQPFIDIKSMKWRADNNDCILHFHGDIFETEDQRNWSDASYKTYCTPLFLPFPAKVNKGDKINQKVEFVYKGTSSPIKEENSVIKITVFPEKNFGLPRIGIGRSSRPEPLTDREIQIIKELGFDHYRVDIQLFSSGWRDRADIAAREAARLEYPLEIALFFDDNIVQQYELFINWMLKTHPDISVIILYDKNESSTPDLLTDIIAPLLKEALPGVKIGSGTNANFAQLNRCRPGSVHSDFICYSIHPQEHASDNMTLTENMQAQMDTVESARQFSDGREIWVSTVNIQRRFNPNIENYEQPPQGSDMPEQVDTRLMALYGACWTIGSMKYLGEASAGGVTYFETAGERGIIQGDFPSRWPEKFKSVNGMIFPVYHALRYILKNKSLRIIRSESAQPLIINMLSFTDGKKISILLANFTSSKQHITINGCHGELSMKQLDADNFALAVSDPDWLENSKPAVTSSSEQLLITPYSINFIEGFISTQ